MVKLVKEITTIITEVYQAYEYDTEEERKTHLKEMNKKGMPGSYPLYNKNGKFMAYFTKATQKEL